MYLMLMYDIPERVRFPNPSGELWKCAVRINKSVWVVHKDCVPNHLLNEMTREGVVWHLVPWDAKANEYIYEMARAALLAEINRQEDSYAQSVAEANLKDRSKPDRDAYIQRVSAAYNRVMRSLNAALQCIGVFDFDGLTVTPMRQRISELHALATARTSVYVSLAASAEGTTVGVAAREDAIPGAILADVIEDRDGVSMEAQQSVFVD